MLDIRTLVFGCCISLAVGCVGGFKDAKGTQYMPTHLLDDDAYEEVDGIPSVNDIYHLSPEAIKKLHRDYDDRGPHEGIRSWFVGYIHEIFKDFEYLDQTTVAQETLDSKRGNCLSLAILTSALARELKIPHMFQEVIAPHTWDRQNGTILRSKHINVLVYEPANDDDDRSSNLQVLYLGTTVSVIDFFPVSDTHPSHLLTDDSVAAMFYANLSAQSLVMRNYGKAYWILRTAIEVEPGYGQSFNMLALVYSHTGNKLAEQTFYHALELEPDCMSTIGNLVTWLNRWDQKEEASYWNRRLEKFKKENPFYFYDLAEIAFEQEDYYKAILLYRKAIAIDEFQHEFHFGLFKSYFRLNKFEQASLSLQLAIERTNDINISNLYMKKMDKLTDR